MFNDFKFSDVVTESVAVNVCENCGRACETLHDLSDGWNFKACDQCAEDAARADAREAAYSIPWVLSQTAPHFTPRYACIGNGLYVRTGSGKKRRSR